MGIADYQDGDRPVAARAMEGMNLPRQTTPDSTRPHGWYLTSRLRNTELGG